MRCITIDRSNPASPTISLKYPIWKIGSEKIGFSQLPYRKSTAMDHDIAVIALGYITSGNIWFDVSYYMNHIGRQGTIQIHSLCNYQQKLIINH